MWLDANTGVASVDAVDYLETVDHLQDLAVVHPAGHPDNLTV